MIALVYTLGRTSVYDPYIVSDPNAGKRKGGSVWRTREDAETYRWAYQLSDFSVYGVAAEWGVDTQPDLLSPAAAAALATTGLLDEPPDPAA